jgi:protein ImuB
LPTERWRLEHEEAGGEGAPLVFTEKVKGALRIVAASSQALGLGLSPGLALADARARVPNLYAIDHDPAGDDRLMVQLADWCDRYTPMVALDPPYGVMLDVTGCTHPFGAGVDAAAALATDVVTRIRAKGLHARHALAETPDRARALARFAQPLPVAALDCSDRDEAALRRAGLTMIKDLATRPRAALAARFGMVMTTKLARILGEEDVHITPRRAVPALFVIRRFAEPIARTDFVLSTLEALVGEAAITLTERGEGGKTFSAHLFRSDGAVHFLGISTGAPTRDPQLVMRLLRERIDALRDPLDPGFGYDLIRLAVPDTAPLSVAQLKLEGGENLDKATGALIDRLGVRLGTARIRRFASGDSHIPEQAAFSFPTHAPPLPRPFLSPEKGEPPLRPLHLFTPPQRIDVMAEVPDGPPRRFRWRRCVHDVTRYEGPERIAAQWWTRRDMRGLTRDYYRVEDVRGRRFWVFRHGLYSIEKDQPDWYVHGVFA